MRLIWMTGGCCVGAKVRINSPFSTCWNSMGDGMGKMGPWLCNTCCYRMGVGKGTILEGRWLLCDTCHYGIGGGENPTGWLFRCCAAPAATTWGVGAMVWRNGGCCWARPVVEVCGIKWGTWGFVCCTTPVATAWGVACGMKWLWSAIPVIMFGGADVEGWGWLTSCAGIIQSVLGIWAAEPFDGGWAKPVSAAGSLLGGWSGCCGSMPTPLNVSCTHDWTMEAKMASGCGGPSGREWGFGARFFAGGWLRLRERDLGGLYWRPNLDDAGSILVPDGGDCKKIENTFVRVGAFWGYGLWWNVLQRSWNLHSCCCALKYYIFIRKGMGLKFVINLMSCS